MAWKIVTMVDELVYSFHEAISTDPVRELGMATSIINISPKTQLEPYKYSMIWSSDFMSLKEFRTFKKMMKSDALALLNKDHPVLGGAARIKINYGHNPIKSIINTDAKSLEELVNKYNNL
jgi:hypothetical protein